MNNPPIATKRAGAMKATIWENQNEKNQIYHSVVISRTYRDDQGDWKETNQLFTDQLPLAQLVSAQAFAFIQERLETLRVERAAAKKTEAEEPEKPVSVGKSKRQSHAEKVTADRIQNSR